MKLKLESDSELIGKIRYLFVKYDYPEKARSFVQIGFASQETVDRDWKGNLYSFLK